ncbi:MAG: MotA/TolQ/ExbB proton channel family protein [Candidatus Eisenbacteria bacterium]|nr:MotA/TolQ/ExbB proton channel family protein [Candidatus Eisenbacteria bacterium]
MKQSIFMFVVLVVAFVVALGIFLYLLPDYLRAGGPLVVILIMLSIMVITFIFERSFALRASQGKGSVLAFLKSVKQDVIKNNIDGAIAACDKQGGTAASVLQAGLERYKELKDQKAKLGHKETMEEVQTSINDAMMLETPLLEKNLVVLSTIATVSVLTGLLGTVIGMIRAFNALAHAGAPDAIQLSQGISEALVNTAGGLLAAILAIVSYNYFFTKIDSFTYMIDEASFSMIKTLSLQKEE